MYFLEIISDNVDQGIDVSAIYIDFAKAFDSVHHGNLLYKLKSFGIDGALLSWIKNFLSDRKQRVVIRGSTCLLYTSPSPRDLSTSRMPSSA